MSIRCEIWHEYNWIFPQLRYEVVLHVGSKIKICILTISSSCKDINLLYFKNFFFRAFYRNKMCYTFLLMYQWYCRSNHNHFVNCYDNTIRLWPNISIKSLILFVNIKKNGGSQKLVSFSELRAIKIDFNCVTYFYEICSSFSHHHT